MPELPEVETVCRSLRQTVVGRTITAVEVRLPKIVHRPEAEQFCQLLKQQNIADVARRGKYIIIKLEAKQALVVHLRMTGKLLYESCEIKPQKHTHVILSLDNGYDLRYDDTRQFGTMDLVPENQLQQLPGLNALGLEPLENSFTLEAFSNILKGKHQKAKSFLLDQRNIAGIGNIYADEILFQARIHPEDTTSLITAPEDVEGLWFAIRDRLCQAVDHGGSSIRDYVDSFGQAGRFQNYHKVYGRAGQPCITCGSMIESIKISGRSTCFCPNCQPRRVSAG